MVNLPDNITNLLQKRVNEDSFRKLSLTKHLIDFSSNDYLGFATNNLLNHSSNHPGSTGSRLVTGNSAAAEEAELYLAKAFNFPSALIFNSGYDANLGLFSSIAHRNDVIIYDEFIHASIKDGCRLSNARSFSFKHNSLSDLEEKLARAKTSTFVAVESVYSMDGDFAPLEELVKLCEKYNAFLIVDEAHALGVTKERLGLVCELKLQEKVFVTVVTFGKAAGCHGAAVLGGTNLKEFLINFARSFIYTTALPASAYDNIANSVKYIIQRNDLQEQLQENIDYFKSLLPTKVAGLLSSCRGPIQSLVIPGNEQVKDLSAMLASCGFDVRSILSPTVPKGTERLRICLHSFNTKPDIKRLCELLVVEI
jgi:8-amino-7-oxononanoate synthase